MPPLIQVQKEERCVPAAFTWDLCAQSATGSIGYLNHRSDPDHKADSIHMLAQETVKVLTATSQKQDSQPL